MERIFIKDVGKLHKRGTKRDLPMMAWNRIAEGVGEPLDSFSMTIEEFALQEIALNEVESGEVPKIRRRHQT